MTEQERIRLQEQVKTCRTPEKLKEMTEDLKRRKLSGKDAARVSGGVSGRVMLTPEETERVTGGAYSFTEPMYGYNIPFHKDTYSMGSDYWYDQAAIIECMFEAGGFNIDEITDFIVNYYGGTAADTKDALTKGPFYWADCRRNIG